jgi:hypothetical protein
MNENEKETYLRTGGWFQNDRGWWHPPNCLASWPIDEAVEMARKDEIRGTRISQQEAEEYLRGET